MKFIPLYFFLALFIGFLFLYTIKNDPHIVMKDKNENQNDTQCKDLSCLTD
jgi:hypothetical protein